MEAIIPVEMIRGKILLIRGQKVLLDSDLAEMYGVLAKVLNQAVKRNITRFPSDFMFQLNESENTEWIALRSQTVTLKHGRGAHRKYFPHVFTEQGVAMLSSVLKSERAVQVNIAIMRAFVQLRELAASNRVLSKRLDDLEKKYDKHDRQFMDVFDAIRQLMVPPEVKKKRAIGFGRGEENKTCL